MKSLIVVASMLSSLTSYAAFSDIKSGQIYIMKPLECAIMVETHPGDNILQLRKVHNPESGFFCETLEEFETLQCSASECTSLNSVPGESTLYRLIEIANTGNFQRSKVACSRNAKNELTCDKARAWGKEFWRVSKAKEIQTGKIFPGSWSSWYKCDGTPEVKKEARKKAMLESEVSAMDNCSYFHTDCKVDHNLTEDYTNSSDCSTRVFVRGQ